MRMSPEQTMRANLAMAAGLQKQGVERWESLMQVGGGVPEQARMMLNYATDPKRHERYMAQLDTQIAKAEADASALGRARVSKWAEEHRAGGLYKGFRSAGRWISDVFTDEFDPEDMLEAEEEARNIAYQEEAARMGTRTFRQAVTGGGRLSSRVVDAMTEQTRGAVGSAAGNLMLGDRTWLTELGIGDEFNARIDPATGVVGLVMGGGALSEEEMVRMQRMTGDYETVAGYFKRSWLADVTGSGLVNKRQEYNRMMARAEESVGVIRAAQKRSTKDQNRLEHQLVGQFRKWGLAGPEALADLKRGLSKWASRKGEEAEATSADDIATFTRDFLNKYKDPQGRRIPEGQVKKFLAANPTLIKEVMTKSILDTGDDKARGSVLEAGAVGSAFKDYTTVEQLSNIEDLQEKMHDNLLDWLEKGDVIEVDWRFGLDAFEEVGQRKAFEAMHAAMGSGATAKEGAEEAYVMALHAAAQGEGAAADRAARKLQVLKTKAYETKDKKLMARLDRASSQYNKLDEEGKKSLGKYLEFFRKEIGPDATDEDIISALEKAQAQEGDLARMMSPEALASIIKQFKGEGKVALDEGGIGLAPASKELDKLKAKKKAAEDLHKVWTGPGGVAEKFDEGMGKLDKAVQKLHVAAEALLKKAELS
jgi:hypothetical protein